MVVSVNSILNWDDNLLAIFEAKLTFKYQSLCIASVVAVVPRVYRDVMSLLRYKSNVMV